MQDLKKIQQTLKSIENCYLWLEIVSRIGITDGIIEVTVVSGAIYPIFTLRVPAEGFDRQPLNS